MYVTGLSNGGHMAYRLARDLSDQIAAIAPVAAVLPESFARSGVSSRPVAVLIIAGTADPVSPYKGGKARLLWRLLILRSKGVPYLSAAETARFWADANHCAGDPITTPLPIANSSDRTRVRQTVYSGGAAPVVLYTVEGGGHTWPGGWQYMPAFFIGKASRQLDACQVIWEFFQSLGHNFSNLPPDTLPGKGTFAAHAASGWLRRENMCHWLLCSNFSSEFPAGCSSYCWA